MHRNPFSMQRTLHRFLCPPSLRRGGILPPMIFQSLFGPSHASPRGKISFIACALTQSSHCTLLGLRTALWSIENLAKLRKVADCKIMFEHLFQFRVAAVMLGACNLHPVRNASDVSARTAYSAYGDYHPHVPRHFNVTPGEHLVFASSAHPFSSLLPAMRTLHAGQSAYGTH